MKRFILVFSFITFLYANTTATTYDGSVKLRIVQFNILQGWDTFNTSSETEGYGWVDRREPCIKMLSSLNADILCIQEARKGQCNFLKERMPEYSQLLYPKDGIETNGGQRDLIMYKTSKYKLLEWDKFWFSETPDASSYSWDAGTPKLTIRAKFQCLEGLPKTFWVYDTHFFPSGEIGKQMCSNMILESMKNDVGEDNSILLCGDLNLVYQDARLDTLLTFMDDAATTAPISDGPEVVTYNGFRTTNQKTLDHIYGHKVKFLTYHVENDQTKWGINWVSDHYALSADVEIPLEMQDTVRYEETSTMTLENKWLLSNMDFFNNVNLADSKNYHGLLAEKDTVYLLMRAVESATSNCQLEKIDAKTGKMIEKYILPDNVKCKTYPCNDIMKDDAGNIVICNYSISSAKDSLRFFVFDNKKGTVEKLVTYKPKNALRLEHCAVKGDVTTGTFDIYIAVAASAKLIKHSFTNGVLSNETVHTLTGFYPTSLTKFGTVPRVCMVNENLCVINSNTTHPTLYDLSTLKAKSTFASNKTLTPEDVKMNGFATFMFKDKRYVVYPAYSTTSGYSFNLVETDGNLDFTSMNKLWKLPQNGLGTTESSNSEVLVDYTIEGDTAFIYLFAPGNGCAKYALASNVPTSVHSTQSANGNMQITSDKITWNTPVSDIVVYNTQGTAVKSQKKASTLSLKGLNKGIYIVNYKINNKEYSQKICW